VASSVSGRVYQFHLPYSSPPSQILEEDGENRWENSKKIKKNRQSLQHFVINNKMPATMGWLRHVLTVLSVVIFLIGCMIIGYMAWILATSVTVTRFLDGNLIFTYVAIGLGFTLFFSGLIGWVGGASESPCLVRLFLFSVIVSMVAEIGGIISLNIVRLEFDDILQFGWQEVNQGTRNLIQKSLDCCGWDGPKEFAYNSEPIDDSCYVNYDQGNSGVIGRQDDPFSTKKMKQDACGPKLFSWFEENKITWVTVLASVAALQVMCIGIAIYILSRIKRLKKLRSSRTSSKKRLYDSSSDSSGHDFRHRI